MLKPLIFDGCFSFDTHDDANHAFPNLKVARDSIANFQLPLINFYNNFGVPLLGDGLTYPFGVHSATYWFFAEHVAMTINRILIVAISVVSSFFFFRIYLSYVAAIICAVTAFFIPIVFWYPVHQYQMASVFYFLILIFSHRYFYKPTRVNLLLVQFLWVFMILSVSINHVIIFLPFG